jgi:hypothetical protein
MTSRVGAQNFRRDDKVKMITREDSGERLVDSPGTVLDVRTYPFRNGTAAFINPALDLVEAR